MQPGNNRATINLLHCLILLQANETQIIYVPRIRNTDFQKATYLTFFVTTYYKNTPWSVSGSSVIRWISLPPDAAGANKKDNIPKTKFQPSSYLWILEKNVWAHPPPLFFYKMKELGSKLGSNYIPKHL